MNVDVGVVNPHLNHGPPWPLFQHGCAVVASWPMERDQEKHGLAKAGLASGLPSGRATDEGSEAGRALAWFA
jgi:hypothetical protein